MSVLYLSYLEFLLSLNKKENKVDRGSVELKMSHNMLRLVSLLVFSATLEVHAGIEKDQSEREYHHPKSPQYPIQEESQVL